MNKPVQTHIHRPFWFPINACSFSFPHPFQLIKSQGNALILVSLEQITSKFSPLIHTGWWDSRRQGKKKSLPSDKAFLTFELFVIYEGHKTLIPKMALEIIIITGDLPGAGAPCSRGLSEHTQRVSEFSPHLCRAQNVLLPAQGHILTSIWSLNDTPPAQTGGMEKIFISEFTVASGSNKNCFLLFSQGRPNSLKSSCFQVIAWLVGLTIFTFMSSQTGLGWNGP